MRVNVWGTTKNTTTYWTVAVFEGATLVAYFECGQDKDKRDILEAQLRRAAKEVRS